MMYGNDQAKMQSAGYGYEGMAGATIGGGLAGANAIEKRQPEIVMQVQKLEKALTYAEESVRELLNRLDPVTRPSPPTETASGNIGPAGPMTEMGRGLDTFACTAHRVADRVQDVLRRLEI